MDASTHLLDLGYAQAVDALIADEIDVAVFPQDAVPLQRVLDAPGIRLMSVVQAEAIWQRYTSFWLTSLLNRIAFFVIPVVAALIPVVGFALSIYRWLYIRRFTRSERSTRGE